MTIGLYSDKGEGEEGLSLSELKSAFRRAGRFLGPLPLIFLAHDRSESYWFEQNNHAPS